MTSRRAGPLATLATVGLAVTAATTTLAWALPYREGPPVAHTGGFGEPTCEACHFGSPLNAAPGAVHVGVPAAFEPGERYELTVVLRHPEMAAAGFQLAVRFADGDMAGRQAGSLWSLSEAVAVTVDTATGIAYAHQTVGGTLPGSDGRTHWTLWWEAPSEGMAGGSADGMAEVPGVVFHVAANAANDDASEFGDRVYTDSTRARALPPR